MLQVGLDNYAGRPILWESDDDVFPDREAAMTERTFTTTEVRAIIERAFREGAYSGRHAGWEASDAAFHEGVTEDFAWSDVLAEVTGLQPGQETWDETLNPALKEEQ